MIVHEGRQWAVGHGGFYTGEVRSSVGPYAFRYVYDCGAMERPSLDESIDDYIHMIPDPGGIDLIAISHVDQDHVKGMKLLIEHASDHGMRVGRVMMPLLSPTDQLIALARLAQAREDDGGPPDDGDDFSRDLVLRPVDLLAQYGVEVVFVAGDDDAGGEPLGPDPVVDDGDPWRPDEPYDVERDEFRDRRDTDTHPADGREGGSSAFDGRPVIRMAGYGAVRVSHGGRALTMSHRNGLVVRESAGGGSWLLAPYVSPRITAQRDRFLAALAGSPEAAVGFERRLGDAEMLRYLTDDIPALKAAYTAAGGTNAGSMSLFSGPFPREKASAAVLLGDPSGAPIQPDGYGSSAPGTLMTGDAELKTRPAVGDLVHHYAGYTDSIGMLNLPHHASRYNSGPLLLAALPAVKFAFAMTPDSDPKGRHPSQEVLDAVEAAKARWHLVTTDAASTVVTRVEVG